MHAALLSVLVCTVVGGSALASEDRADPTISAASARRIEAPVQPRPCNCGNCVVCPRGMTRPPALGGLLQRYRWFDSRWPWYQPCHYDRMPHDYRRGFDYPWRTGPRIPFPVCPPPY